jgi:hypothetical protein
LQRMAKALPGLERTPTPTHAADALAVALSDATAPALLRLAGEANGERESPTTRVPPARVRRGAALGPPDGPRVRTWPPPPDRLRAREGGQSAGVSSLRLLLGVRPSQARSRRSSGAGRLRPSGATKRVRFVTSVTRSRRFAGKSGVAGHGARTRRWPRHAGVDPRSAAWGTRNGAWGEHAHRGLTWPHRARGCAAELQLLQPQPELHNRGSTRRSLASWMAVATVCRVTPLLKIGRPDPCEPGDEEGI